MHESCQSMSAESAPPDAFPPVAAPLQAARSTAKTTICRNSIFFIPAKVILYFQTRAVFAVKIFVTVNFLFQRTAATFLWIVVE